MNLEELAEEIEKKGKLLVQAEQVANRMKELKKTVLAKVQTDIEVKSSGTKLSENKLERLALASTEYEQHIIDMCESQRLSGELEKEYDKLKNFFEATRSNMAMERARMNLV